MRILVTGATGFLGNNVVRALLQLDHDIVITKRINSDLRPLDGLDLEAIDIDFHDHRQLPAVVEGVDVVIHSAAQIQLGWSKLESSRKTNVQATQALAQCARRRDIRMIHVSTVDTLAASDGKQPIDENQTAPPKPACSYVISKREAELAFFDEVNKGLDGVVVNPGFMVGPYDWKPSSGEMMLALHKGWIPFAPAGGCSVADVRDVADAIIAAIDHGRTGEKYILGGENLTYLQLWKMMAQTMGRPEPKFVLPDWLAELAGRGGDLAGKFLKNEPQVNSAATRMGQIFHWYDSSKAERELGYRWQSVSTALEDAWNWFQTHDYV